LLVPSNVGGLRRSLLGARAGAGAGAGVARLVRRPSSLQPRRRRRPRARQGRTGVWRRARLRSRRNPARASARAAFPVGRSVLPPRPLRPGHAGMPSL
ncbi:hypothetical protein OC834_007924, partial [Tilletia horrida]